jgi:hypothetical protein
LRVGLALQSLALYPDIFNEIINSMITKNVDPNTIQWSYDYCVKIDNSPKPTSLQESIDNVNRNYGISITAKSGRKKSSFLVKKIGIESHIPKV